MKIYSKVSDCLYQFTQISWTIGNFDGVHRGHRHLISQLRNDVGMIGVITFDPHPAQYFLKDKYQGRLFSIEDQNEVFQSLGVDVVLRLKFDFLFSNLSALEFAESVLNPLKIKTLYVGYDFQFGKDKGGDFYFLKNYYKLQNTSVYSVNAYKDLESNLVVSTTLIKEKLKNGDLKEVENFLGRKYAFSGLVIGGKKIGSKIGFPTANIDLKDLFIPKLGVYICQVEIENQVYKAVVNIGYRPTVDAVDLKLSIECHILDFNRDLYNKKLKIIFYSYLREEKKFLSIEKLVEQINVDIKKCKDYLYEN